MSRTDNTKPLWVRHAEHDPRPIHDHRYGDCDLPPRPERDAPDTRCRWEPPGAHIFFGTCCAGCQIRSHRAEWQEIVRAANRRDRYAARRETRRLRDIPGDDT
ncbi:hypothetical protein [Nocardiopsis trehalosi]|jgi:hypothetical protein|uniref:hypothetical protein n=1 Tax=Nocardiopsis trehalosi TaxID=109329 RepID=UPI0008341563|nr:hypothetical protein [Nocardiopsis trehalosi]